MQEERQKSSFIDRAFLSIDFVFVVVTDIVKFCSLVFTFFSINDKIKTDNKRK